MDDLKTLKFDALGRGMSSAAAWFTIAGVRQCVQFSAAHEGPRSSTRRTWHVIATYYTSTGTRMRSSVTIRNCYRYEAAQAALDALSETAPVMGMAS
jgi:hypothetical protein